MQLLFGFIFLVLSLVVGSGAAESFLFRDGTAQFPVPAIRDTDFAFKPDKVTVEPSQTKGLSTFVSVESLRESKTRKQVNVQKFLQKNQIWMIPESSVLSSGFQIIPDGSDVNQDEATKQPEGHRTIAVTKEINKEQLLEKLQKMPKWIRVKSLDDIKNAQATLGTAQSGEGTSRPSSPGAVSRPGPSRSNKPASRPGSPKPVKPASHPTSPKPVKPASHPTSPKPVKPASRPTSPKPVKPASRPTSPKPVKPASRPTSPKPGKPASRPASPQPPAVKPNSRPSTPKLLKVRRNWPVYVM